jgi:uncharacterized protein YbjT (DUF2867 family)
MKIAVVGATGNTGRAVVKELKALGEDPIAVVRNPDKAREVLGPDVKTVVAELTDKAALEKAFAGVDRVFVVTGHNPGMVEQQNNVLDAALKAGVKYLVRVGGGRPIAKHDSPSVVGRSHAAIEDRLRQSAIKWVILRPGLFMQNVLGQAGSIKNDGKFVMPYAKDFKLALIDVRDTGAVGARILIDPEPHVGKVHEFTGTTTTFGDFAEMLSEVLGRKITYIGVTPEQSAEAMKARGMPDWLVTHVLTIGQVGNSGGFSNEDTKLIHDLVKRPPISAKKFAEDFKAAFA